jgi:hypothetical protein
MKVPICDKYLLYFFANAVIFWFQRTILLSKNGKITNTTIALIGEIFHQIPQLTGPERSQVNAADCNIPIC